MLCETATGERPSFIRLHSSVSPRCERHRHRHRRWKCEQEASSNSPNFSREPLTSFSANYRAPHLSSRGRQRRAPSLAGPDASVCIPSFADRNPLTEFIQEIETYDAQTSSSYPRLDGGFVGANVKSKRTRRPATKRRKRKVCLLRQDGLRGLQGCKDVLPSREARKGRESILLCRRQSDGVLQQRGQVLHEGR
jgi:hypothetical protein